jgi:hypothetical protein
MKHAGAKGCGGTEKRLKFRVVVLHGKQETPVARARVFERENEVVFILQRLELWAPFKTH